MQACSTAVSGAPAGPMPVSVSTQLQTTILEATRALCCATNMATQLGPLQALSEALQTLPPQPGETAAGAAQRAEAQLSQLRHAQTAERSRLHAEQTAQLHRLHGTAASAAEMQGVLEASLAVNKDILHAEGRLECLRAASAALALLAVAPTHSAVPDAAMQAAIAATCPPSAADDLCSHVLADALAAMRNAFGALPRLDAVSAALQSGSPPATCHQDGDRRAPTPAASNAQDGHVQVSDTAPNARPHSQGNPQVRYQPRLTNARTPAVFSLFTHTCTKGSRSTGYAGVGRSREAQCRQAKLQPVPWSCRCAIKSSCAYCVRGARAYNEALCAAAKL